MNSVLLKDGYKVGHIFQYPDGTEEVYSNFTPRSSRIGIEKVVFFGLQYFIKKYLIKDFNENFFQKPKNDVVGDYKNTIDGYLGKDSITVDHIAALHDLGYLPIEIKALPEGARIPLRVPMLTIKNTLPAFFWLTNMLETLLSVTLWGPCTSATIAHRYKKLFISYAIETGAAIEFTPFQGHDFSMRGMFGLEAAQMSGAGHLTSFVGTDTIPAIKFVEKYYGCNSLIGASVPATEHSVMCMGGEKTEKKTFERLLKIYPGGILSVVSDTWDFWKIITETLPSLKDTIMGRNGKLVIRPDSGDPVKIIAGDEGAATLHENKGLIDCLWDTFGGATNNKGFKELDSHIGAIYGDSITYERAEQILLKLKAKGYASSNIVFGIGSYTYQYNTRDTFGFAMKATAGVISGQSIEIFKDPKTDNGEKKSAKGYLKIVKEKGEYALRDQQLPGDDENDCLSIVFRNGKLINPVSFDEVRDRLK